MATYNTAFGALPGYKELIGREPGQFQQQQPQQSQTPTQQQSAQTFSQLQQQGMARPAPPQAPMGQQYQQWGGSQQAQQARSGMLGQLQQQLAQPTRFDTDAFQQIRSAQAQNLQAEFGAQRQLLDEEMARRGLSASSITAGRYGDLLGQQSRALSDLDAQLLMAAAQTQAQDRLAAMQAATDFAGLAGSQDLAQFEANRVAQAQQFQEALQGAQFQQGQYEQGGAQALAAAQAAQQGEQVQFQQELARLLGLSDIDLRAAQLGLQAGEATGQLGGQQTLSAQQLAEQQRQFDIQQQLAQTLGLGQLGQGERELDLRAQQIQQEAQLQGRSLDLQQARDQAQQEQFAAQQALERERFYGTLDAEEGQFARSLDEQRSLRLQNLGISEAQLEQEARRLTQQDRSLSLQEARDQAEVDFRSRQLMQQAELEGRSLTIQEARLQADQDIQWARLEEETAARLQQFGISTQQLQQEATRIANQAQQFGQQLSLQDRIQSAEVNLRAQQIANEYERSGQSISLDQARLVAQQQIEADRLTFNREELANRRNEFDRTLEQQTRESALERNLRQLLQSQELGARETIASRDAGLRSREIDVNERLATNQLMMNLAQVLGSLSSADIARMLANLGTNPTPTPTPTPTPRTGDPDPDDSRTPRLELEDGNPPPSENQGTGTAVGGILISNFKPDAQIGEFAEFGDQTFQFQGNGRWLRVR